LLNFRKVIMAVSKQLSHVKLHNDLVFYVGGKVYPGSSHWKAFTYSISNDHDLSEKEINSCTSFEDIIKCLVEKEKISYGNYTYLSAI